MQNIGMHEMRTLIKNTFTMLEVRIFVDPIHTRPSKYHLENPMHGYIMNRDSLRVKPGPTCGTTAE